MLVWPEHRPVQIVQHAVAVWPEERHVARRRDKLLLQIIIAGFGKARGKTDRAAAPHRRQLGRHLDHRVAVDSQKGCIRCRWQVGQTAETGDAVNLVAFRMNRPDVAVKAGFQALLDDILRPPSAKNGNGTRAEQTRQPAHLIPRAGEADRG